MLQRSEIVRKDFPVERRGYAPEMVDRHLEKVAAEIDELRNSASKGGDRQTVAGTAGQRVQAIVDAAEHTAEEIERDARAEAQRIRDDASREAKERVGEVKSAAESLRERIDGLQGELGSIFEELRANAKRVSESLGALDQESASIRSQSPQAEAATTGVTTEPEAAPKAPAAEAPAGPATATQSAPAAPAAPAPAAEAGGGEENAQNARLVALNMALNGASRKETQRYLAENFSIDDPSQLLDDVYAQRGA